MRWPKFLSFTKTNTETADAESTAQAQLPGQTQAVQVQPVLTPAVPPAATQSALAPQPTANAAKPPAQLSPRAQQLAELSRKLKTIVAKGTVFEGRIKSETGFKIDGELILTEDLILPDDDESLIWIGPQGKVTGNIRAGNIRARYIIVQGHVAGHVHALRDARVDATGVIAGGVTYQNLRLADGATINGALTHASALPVPQPEPKLAAVPEAPAAPIDPIMAAQN